MRKPILAITMGDPGGIGPEVIARAFRDFTRFDECYYVIIGSRAVFDFLGKTHQMYFPIYFVSSFDVNQFRTDSVNFLDITGEASGILGKGKDSFSFDIGKISAENAAFALAALKVAAEEANRGMIDAIVTAPVNKTAMRLIHPNFIGHTEYFAESSKTKKFAMMFVGDRLKVTLVTIHVPLKQVSQLITTQSVYEKITLTDEFLKAHLNMPTPRIAVCALNPHGRETGEEDEKFIAPAVKKALAEKRNVTGPLSADQLFFDAYEGRFDAVISMYHDQGLGPFKMISFRDGVNVTLGLPYIRTSPDHGTALDIAYQGKADDASMKSAIRLAEKLLLA